MSELNLSASRRTLTGQKVRQLRAEGWVPVVVYGAATENANLQVAERELDRVLHQGGYSQLVEVKVEGGDVHNILIREVQRDPVSHHFVHADFYAVNMAEEQEVSVSIIPIGDPGELVAGLMVFQALDVVEIRALPTAIPGHIDVDITELSLDRPILISDLPDVAGVTYLGELEDHVFTMITTRIEEPEEEEEVEEELLEPEVLAKGKQEEEDEEEG